MRQFLALIVLAALFVGSAPRIDAQDVSATDAVPGAAETYGATALRAAAAAAAKPRKGTTITISVPAERGAAPLPPVAGAKFTNGSCTAGALPAAPSPSAIVAAGVVDPNFKQSIDYLIDVCGAMLKSRYARYDQEDIRTSTISDVLSGKGTRDLDYRKIAVATCTSTFVDALLGGHADEGPNVVWRAAQLYNFCAATASAVDPPNTDRFFCDGPGEPGNPQQHPGGQAGTFLALGAALILFSALGARAGLKTTTNVLGVASLGAPALCGFTNGPGIGTTLTSLSGVLGAPAAAAAP